ncbi:diaminopimelate decarboxylase [Skermanella aerolata]|uniref:Diaminopimelate decarboxylase n=1 Tax=Skermanella aerolata TaxID=393310 RepID=A0A512E0G5_9PROT|nr:diaminopimelate decarboxylase [Skermanella aerolata]KJB91760.1 diaminopimelate decarboxylase [Skermanella aerolata KACC 11604]GEO42226.1 diaminopimelate decarboxylase [Skermanella aerolata]
MTSPYFTYQDGVLHAEGVALPDLAATVGTPFYCYSTAALEANYRAFADAFEGSDTGICYALKANSNLAVIRTLAKLGAGADVVSEGEMRRALAGGIPADRIVFSGVGKTREEMRSALESGIFQLNVESIPELEALSQVASSLDRTAAIAIRVNPDVDAKTHAKIATGKKENKFGIDIDHARQTYARAAALPGIKPVAVAVHIGSQLTSLEPFRAAFERVVELVHALREDGHDIQRLDLGGGLGILYRDEDVPSLDAYAGMVRSITGNLGCHVTLEPGRALVGNAGILVSKVIYRKTGVHREFLIVDAAMNDLIRPSLYDAWHTILPVAEEDQDAPRTRIDVVGPVCESGDTFAVQRVLPHLDQDDLVAFLSAGAYGAVMSSTYNTRPLVPEVLVSGSDHAVVRRRPTVEEMLAAEQVPAWLEK